MSCKCVDENGKYLDKCLGTCGAYRKVNHVSEQERDPMQGLMEIMMAQVQKMIEHQLTCIRVEFQKDQIAVYEKGFKDGIHFGIELGKEHL